MDAVGVIAADDDSDLNTPESYVTQRNQRRNSVRVARFQKKYIVESQSTRKSESEDNSTSS